MQNNVIILYAQQACLPAIYSNELCQVNDLAGCLSVLKKKKKNEKTKLFGYQFTYIIMDVFN